MFGRIMEIKNGSMTTTMKPFARDEAKDFLPGVQMHSVKRYWGEDLPKASVIEDEQEWYDQIRTDKSSFTWGIYVDEEFIGTASLFDIKWTSFAVAVGSIIIRNKDYWGRGIASSVASARLMYAFEQLNLTKIDAWVLSGHEPSLKNVKSVGYVPYYVHRNANFVDNKFEHRVVLECINPNELEWDRWWHGDEIPAENSAAREKTQAALDWAHENVTLI